MGIAETVYKCAVNTSTTVHMQKNMSTQRTLDIEKVREFVGDFNKLFQGLKAWVKDAEQIETWREHFLKKYLKIFSDSSENEVEMDIDEGHTRPKKPNLAEIRERLLCERTEERFTNYEGVMSDPNLTLTERIIHLQKGIDDTTRRKVYFAPLQGKLLQSCFDESKEAYKKTLKLVKIKRPWVQFLHKLHKLVLNYNQLQYCTVSLYFICNSFKAIEEICKSEPDN